MRREDDPVTEISAVREQVSLLAEQVAAYHGLVVRRIGAGSSALAAATEAADVILAGACIVRTICTKLQTDSMTVSDRGLRHGVVIDRFADPGSSSRSVR